MHRRGQVNQYASLVSCIDRIASGCRHTIIGRDTNNIDELDTVLIQPLRQGSLRASLGRVYTGFVLAGCDLILGCQKALKPRVSCLEAALTEVCLNIVGVQILMNL